MFMKKPTYIILGLIILLLVLIVDTLNQPICSLLIAIFGGFSAGYLACREKPQPDYAHAGLQGLKIGLLIGFFSLTGHLLSSLLSELLQNQSPDIASNLGIQADFFGMFGSSFCSGLLELIIFSGTGAIGGIFYTRSRKTDRTHRSNKK
jgi:hypothetical protein